MYEKGVIEMKLIGPMYIMIYIIVLFGLATYFMILLANFLRAGTEAFRTYVNNNKRI